MKAQRPSFLSRHAHLIAWIALGFTLGFGGGFLAASAQMRQAISAFDLPRESLELLQQFYFGELPASIQLQRGMTRGLLDTFEDPYTTYLDPVSNELEEQTLQGAYGGIGAFLTPTQQGWALVPFKDGPAAQAGVLEGDILIKADDIPIDASRSEAEVMAALRGAAGSTARIEIRRQGSETLQFDIFRQILPLPSASSYLYPLEPSIGVINLSGFGAPTLEEVRSNLDDLLAQQIKAIVLDLRNNPGGLLDSSLAVADVFLTEGIIVTELAYDGEKIEHLASSEASDVQLPLAVLVNGGTASAAEVLAAALQANKRAPLFGQTTFGKGSVQSIYGLSDGSSLHITTSRWYDPTGAAIDHRGLQPNHPVEEGTGADDPALQAAIVYLVDRISEGQ
jgi:carboxyl-terminal processing protease